MRAFIDKNRKIIFWVILGINLIIIAGMNHFTPYFSDDITYKWYSDSANTPLDILMLNIDEYLTHNSRFVAQLFLYSYLAIGNKLVSNIIGSFIYIGLGLLIYDNIKGRRKYDLSLLMLVYALMWSFLAVFGQTVLWLAGSVAYLYGIVWIMGFITLYRRALDSNQIKNPVIMTILIFLLAVIAGVSNENSSGGAFLLIFIFTINKLVENKKHKIGFKDSLKPYMVAGHLGVLLGLGLMVLGPGGWTRGMDIEPGNFTGFLGLMSRFYKITVMLKELFLPLLIMILIALVILVVQKRFRGFEDIRENNGIIFLAVGFVVCYVLAVIEPSPPRVYIGASVFFIIALCQMISEINFREEIFTVLKYSLIVIMVIMSLYDTSIGTINLFRINREENQRVEIIKEAAEEGADTAIIPQYSPEFATRFSAAHDNDVTEDPDYWINTYYERYYGVPKIIGITRAEWEEMYMQK